MKYTLENQETKRLKFRLLKDSDFQEWTELFQDKKISKVLGMDKIGTPKEQCEKWFEWTYERYKNNLGGQNVLIEKSTNKIIGQSGLLVRELNGFKELEIAYSILPNYRQKGYATEASQKCRDFAFENKYAKRLISIINTENPNSAKVALNNDMQNDRTIEFHGDTVYIYQITLEKWNERTS
ncbi:GNAT family N-acetyltransferase [Winogradskyella bathintestinalis]|uniref:GNAT family N-acetyltransferase n=1 Tax=Winogradskyella bathintestinalis TaxID=3035208 RepID=A0ABT7ZZE0_9FLAO|nr:GNAT family N-acetyltransferase [Winogradskyella bathintestinalis]MDN3494214.1 GNAT family N-acetyltransferase [Winogradskyella bathintestinalis]